MSDTKKSPKLPGKCLNNKAAYMRATNWWCSMCAPTGGRICWVVCRLIGERNSHQD